MSFSRIFGNIQQNGIELAHNTRNRLRASFMAAKMNAKVQDWTKADDDAFDAIDTMTARLVADAGFQEAPVALSKEQLEKQAEMRGLRLVSNPPVAPQTAPIQPSAPMIRGGRPVVAAEEVDADKLAKDIGDVVADRRGLKPQGFA